MYTHTHTHLPLFSFSSSPSHHHHHHHLAVFSVFLCAQFKLTGQTLIFRLKDRSLGCEGGNWRGQTKQTVIFSPGSLADCFVCLFVLLFSVNSAWRPAQVPRGHGNNLSGVPSSGQALKYPLIYKRKKTQQYSCSRGWNIFLLEKHLKRLISKIELWSRRFCHIFCSPWGKNTCLYIKSNMEAVRWAFGVLSRCREMIILKFYDASCPAWAHSYRIAVFDHMRSSQKEGAQYVYWLCISWKNWLMYWDQTNWFS